MDAPEKLRLTSLSASAGCAAKMGPGDLLQVLQRLHGDGTTHPALLTSVGDDAAVYQLNPNQAIVQTLDFFPPVVDDPYTFGAIAAANAMSDVYAMGGRVLFALNIAAIPFGLDKDVVAAIFQGGADKVAEGGGVIAGGHTITDPEPKYGLCITGIVDPARIFTKGGAQAGDVLILSKPLGVGVLTTALKRNLRTEDDPAVAAAVASMLRLNLDAARVLGRDSTLVHAATDITGFGLLGHASEMCRQSAGVMIEFWADRLPLLPEAYELAAQDCLPGGMGRNRQFLLGETAAGGPVVGFTAGVNAIWQSLLFDPETSGGLLAAVPLASAAGLVAALREAGDSRAAVVGRVLAASPKNVGMVIVSDAREYERGRSV